MQHDEKIICNCKKEIKGNKQYKTRYYSFIDTSGHSLKSRAAPVSTSEIYCFTSRPAQHRHRHDCVRPRTRAAAEQGPLSRTCGRTRPRREVTWDCDGRMKLLRFFFLFNFYFFFNFLTVNFFFLWLILSLLNSFSFLPYINFFFYSFLP